MPSNNILDAKTGRIFLFTVAVTNGSAALSTDEAKQAYISQLLDKENDNVCLIAYCILNTRAYILAKGTSKLALNLYVRETNRAFYAQGDSNGYPFRPVVPNQKVKNKALVKTINSVHRFAPAPRPSDYPYCSYNYLISGKTDAVTIVQNSGSGINDLQEFERALNENVRIRQRAFTVNESATEVMEQLRVRYIKQSMTEGDVIFMVSELCARTSLSYRRAAAKIGVKNRRDIMVGTVCDMILRRRYDIPKAMAAMKLKKESRTGILMEVIAELNRVYSYSYDYILGMLGVSDPEYDLLACLITDMCGQFNEKFETACTRFHILDNLPYLRVKCGF